MLLQDKVIIVTGSTTGIGRAIAKACVAQGARVLIHGLEQEQGREVVQSLGDRAVLHIDDLADPKAPRRIIDTAARAFARIDAIVNNAAFIVRSDIHSTDAALFDKVMAVNLRAPLLLVQAGLEHLTRSRGCVLNIGSNNGYCGQENLLAYSLSKAGLMAMSRNLGDALHRNFGIRVFHFNVGWTLTENELRYKVEDGFPADWAEKLSRYCAPIGRLIKPEEIASMVVPWLGDQSRPFSGTVVDLEQYPFLGRNPPDQPLDE